MKKQKENRGDHVNSGSELADEAIPGQIESVTQNALDRLSRISDCLQKLGKAPSDNIEHLIEHVAKILGADAAAYFELARSDLQIRAAWGFSLRRLDGPEQDFFMNLFRSQRIPREHKFIQWKIVFHIH